MPMVKRVHGSTVGNQKWYEIWGNISAEYFFCWKKLSVLSLTLNMLMAAWKNHHALLHVHFDLFPGLLHALDIVPLALALEFVWSTGVRCGHLINRDRSDWAGFDVSCKTLHTASQHAQRELNLISNSRQIPVSKYTHGSNLGGSSDIWLILWFSSRIQQLRSLFLERNPCQSPNQRLCLVTSHLQANFERSGIPTYHDRWRCFNKPRRRIVPSSLLSRGWWKPWRKALLGRQAAWQSLEETPKRQKHQDSLRKSGMFVSQGKAAWGRQLINKQFGLSSPHRN